MCPASAAGLKLADLHLNYETVETWPLRSIYTPDTPLSLRVERMRLNKDKTELVVSDTLTLAGISPEAFQYRLGNRSALEWLIDQYQVSTDKRSGIVPNPIRDDGSIIDGNERYKEIVELGIRRGDRTVRPGLGTGEYMKYYEW